MFILNCVIGSVDEEECGLIKYDGVETVAEKAKQATGMGKGKAEELAGEAKGKAAELKGEAKGKAAEVKGKM